MDKVPDNTKRLDESIYNSVFSERQLPPVEGSVRWLFNAFPQLKNQYPILCTASVVNESAKNIRWAERCVPLIRPGALGDTYQEELSTVLECFRKTIPLRFIDLLSLDSTDHRIKQSRHTCEALEIAAKAQGHHDLIIIPAQLGREYSGKTMDWVTSHCSVHHGEFGFRLIDTLVTLLIFPERFKSTAFIDCPGDICSVAGVPDHSPILYWSQGTCVLEYRPRYAEDSAYGSLTGCIPDVSLPT